MARIAGINLPEGKKIDIALTYIYGIGRSLSQKILEEAKIEPSKKVESLTPKEARQIQEIISSKYKVEGDLRRAQMMAIKRLKDISCWRGMRHSRHLPVRGQTTRINSRTVRGNVRKTVGSGRKAPPAPK